MLDVIAANLISDRSSKSKETTSRSNKRRRQWANRRTVLTRLIGEKLEDRRVLASFVVNTAVDVVAEDGMLSLREAIEASNTNAVVNADTVAGDPGDVATDTITFADGLSLITLGSELVINDLVAISLGNSTAQTISGGRATRIFSIEPSSTTNTDVSIQGLTLSDGLAESGGAIFVASGQSLNLDSVTLSNNAATGDGSGNGGGAIFNDGGVVSIIGSTITQNQAAATASFALTGEQENPPVATLASGQATFVYDPVDDTFDIDLFVSGLEIDDTTAEGEDTDGAIPRVTAAHIHIGAVGENGPVIIDLNADNFVTEEGGIRLMLSGVEFPAENFDDLVAGNAYVNVHSTDNAGGEVRGQIVFPATMGSGGGIFNNNGTLSVADSIITGNVASRAGGGIEATAGSSTFLSNVILDDNVAGPAGFATPGNGGGLHITGDGDVSIMGGTVNDNVAGLEGGGLWNGSGTLTVDGTTISGNVASGDAADDGGGGVFNNGGTVTVAGAILSGNSADGVAGSGGGILNLGGSVDVTSSSIIGNVANRAGGGVEATAGSTTTLSDVTLNGNTTGPAGFAAPGNGGGLHITGDGDASISGGTVIGNVAASEGGGLWNGSGTLLVDGTEISNNRAAGSLVDQGGGGVFNAGGIVNITDATIADNLASGAGLIALEGSQEVPPVETSATGTAEIQFNALTGTFDLDLFVTGLELEDLTDAPELTMAHIHVGAAGENGPVIVDLLDGESFVAVDGGLRLTLSDVVLPAENVADLSSGNLYFNVHSTANPGGEVRGQIVLPVPMGSGGGILNDGGTVTVSNTAITGNVASRAGGGIEATAGSTTTLTGVTLDNNMAGPAGFATPGNGGGLHITGDGDASISGGTVSGNFAVEGGGLWNSAIGALVVDGTTIEGNTALRGGGIYQQGTGGTVPLQVTFTNVAPDNGPDDSGLYLTPIFNAFHDGTYDLFDVGGTASAGLESLAEDGAVGTINAEFASSQATGVAAIVSGGGPIAPGETVGAIVMLDAVANRFHSFASMVIPSNDAFIGNEDPTMFALFDDAGMFVGSVDLTVPGSAVWDAGTEVNNEINAAFFDQTAPNTGETENGTVALHPGFIDSVGNPGGTPVILGGTQSVARMLTFGNENADFTREGVDLLRIQIEEVDAGLFLDDVTLRNNTATGEQATDGGGGIYNDGSSVTINGSLISGNVASGTSGSGGGVFNGGSFLAETTSIIGNVANRAGGGVEATAGSTTTLLDVALNGNTVGAAGFASPGNGGGLHITGDGDADISGGTVIGNAAASEGGGLWNGTGTLTVDGTEISNNRAAGSLVDQGGGGVFNAGGTVVIIDATIADNTASGAGVIALEGSQEVPSVETSATGTAEIQFNALTGTFDLDLFVTGLELEELTDAPELTMAHIHVGAAGENGPVIVDLLDGESFVAVDGGLRLTLSDVVLPAENAADLSSGNLYFNVHSTANPGGEVRGQIVLPVPMGSGGGILNDGGTVTVSNTAITGNVASRAGGGIEATAGSTTTLLGVTLDDNVAGPAGFATPGNGGGLHITGDGDASIMGGTVNDNVAGLEGGGLWNGSGTLTVDGTTISGNVASGDAADDGGGGIFNNGGTVTVAGAILSGNAADGVAGSGGGILNLGGSVDVTSSSITGNVANRAGGGVEATAGSTTTLLDVALNGNVTGPAGFAAPGNGGGLHITGDGDASISGGTVIGNAAASEGGGLWNGTGTLTVDGTEISNNRAAGSLVDQGGGGVFNAGGTVVIIDATIADNTASGAGVIALEGSQEVPSVETSATGTAEIQFNALTGTFDLDLFVTGLELEELTDAPELTMAHIHVGAAGENGPVIVNLLDSESFVAVDGGLRLTLSDVVLPAENVADLSSGNLYFNVHSTANPGGEVRGQIVLPVPMGSGGGILNDGGTVTVSNTAITGNIASRAGGGIEATAGSTTTLTSVTLDDNVAGPAGFATPGNGGGLHITGDGSVSITETSVAGNIAANEGGGLWNSAAGTISVLRSVVAGNSSGDGGGIFNDGSEGDVSVVNSTLAENTATGSGGGIASEGATVTLTSVTIADNSADIGGGVAITGGSAEVINSIITRNSATTDADTSGTIADNGNNLLGVDAGLATLADNGGPTQTIALIAGSAAVDTGIAAGLATDQRGLPRPQGTAADIGAFESDLVVPSVASLSIAATNADQVEGDDGSTEFTFTVSRDGSIDIATSVDFAVTGDGAFAADANDFGGTLPTGTLNFAAGQTTQTLTVAVTGDTIIEQDEQFLVTLSNPASNAVISDATAVGIIQNDDLIAGATRIFIPGVVARPHVIAGDSVPTAIIFRALTETVVSVVPIGVGSATETIRILNEDIETIGLSGGFASATVDAGRLYAVVFEPQATDRVYSIRSSAGAGALSSRAATNILAPTDTTGDGETTALDALVIINDLSRSGNTEGEQGSAASGMFLDVNRDSTVSALDALLVINHISRQGQAVVQSSTEGEPLAPLPVRFSAARSAGVTDLVFADAASELADPIQGDAVNSNRLLTPPIAVSPLAASDAFDQAIELFDVSLESDVLDDELELLTASSL